MAVSKPTLSKAKKPKAEAKRELEEIVEEVTSAKEASTAYRDQGSMGGLQAPRSCRMLNRLLWSKQRRGCSRKIGEGRFDVDTSSFFTLSSSLDRGFGIAIVMSG